MVDWQKGRLGDFITLKRGYDLPTSERDQNGTIPVISSSGFMSFHNEAKVDGPGVVTGRYGSVGNFFYVDVSYWPLNTTLYVQDFKDNHPLFVFYFLHILNFEKFGDKTSVPGVNRNDLHRIKVSLPPLAEQRKIAQILSTWDEAIALVESLIAALKERKKGLMQRLLTGDVRFPGFDGAWEEVRLGDVVDGKPEYGANSPAIEYSNELPRYIRITDINDEGRLFESGRVSVQLSGNEKYTLKSGDFLFARSGATVGKTYLYRESDGWCIFAGYLIRFRPNVLQLLPEFIEQFTNTHRYWYWVRSNLRAGAQPNINAQEYSSLLIPLPLIEEQAQITSLLEICDSEMYGLNEYILRLRKQKKGLMQRLLTGEVRV